MVMNTQQHLTPTGGVPRVPEVPYMPGLDGLRALAVLAVVVYHANESWLGGGFLGVEVFFVISGYLITALLVSSHANSAGVPGLLAYSLACLALSALMGLVFWFAPLLGRLLGETAMHISTQVMGLVVAAIASQMVLNGLRTAFPVLAAHS